MNALLDEAWQRYPAAQRDMTSLDILIASGHAPHETIGFWRSKLVRNNFVQQSLQTANPAQ